MLYQINISIQELDYDCATYKLSNKGQRKIQKKLWTEPGINFGLDCSNTSSMSKNNKLLHQDNICK